MKWEPKSNAEFLALAREYFGQDINDTHNSSFHSDGSVDDGWLPF